MPTKGAQNIPLIPALYALLNPDDGSDHPKSNLVGRVRPGRSPAAKSISLQKSAAYLPGYVPDGHGRGDST